MPAIPSRPARAPQTESLESRIGSQWLNRVGIITVLVGVAFFLKYAFESNWIGAAGRVSIGLIAGIAVVVWSEQFRKRDHIVFSWSLKAVGIGTLYLSLWAGYQVYHLFPSGVAFAAMVVVTAATAAMSLTQNAEVLAAFALIGGFVTPLLLSSGQNHEVALFSYVALLDAATLVLVTFRPWRRLLAGAFVGTTVLYIAWYTTWYSRDQLAATVSFATVFFVIFAVAPLTAKDDSRQGSARPGIAPTLVLLPLFNAAVYFLEIYVIVSPVDKGLTAWIALALAAAYIALSRAVRSRLPASHPSARLLSLLHVALAIGFVTTAIPLKLGNHWITVGWFAESGVLIWIAYRSANQLLKILGLGALVLGLARLFLWDNFNPTQIVFNARFGLYLAAIAVVALAVYVAQHSEDSEREAVVAIGVILINALALVALNLEVRDYFVRSLATFRETMRGARFDAAEYRAITISRDFAYSAVWMAYGAVLMWVGFWKRSAFLRWQALILLAATVVKVFVFDTSQLDRAYRIISFMALGVILLAVSFIYQRDWLKLSRRAADRDDTRGTSAQA